MPDADRSLWHTVPLHYLPHLLAGGALFSAERLARNRLPIRPRPTAAARVRKLGLAGYIHLSLSPRTPLLADKRAKGYPHVLLEFDRELVFALPGVALMRFNTKSWRHRDDYVPVTDPTERVALLTAHANGRYPSLEILVPGALNIATPTCHALHLSSPAEEEVVLRPLLLAGLITVPEGITTHVGLEHFPLGPTPDLTSIIAYTDACVASGTILPPPIIPFD